MESCNRFQFCDPHYHKQHQVVESRDYLKGENRVCVSVCSSIVVGYVV